MQDYKKKFIEFMVECGVLTFGDFVTKSGRKTPFFINTGNYKTGAQLIKLGEFYSEAIVNQLKSPFNVLFGPAYKGIPLAVCVAMTLSSKYNQNVAFCFNRKEVKNHGEGGNLIGHKLKDGDRVLIIEDVTTAGTSVRESIPLINSIANVTIAGLVVSVDRMERGSDTRGALVELQDEFSMPAFSIVTLSEIIEHLHNKEINGKVILDDAILMRINEYRNLFGTSI